MGNRLLTNTQKERLSIRAIENLCDRAGNIEADIQSNDKTPSWDGSLFLYKKYEFEECSVASNKKENLLKKINIQLKSSQVKKLSGKKIKYSMEISDLRNYYNNEGIILFYVEIVDFDKIKIYYRNLLPLDLKHILNEVDKKNRNRKKKGKYSNQKTKDIEIYELRPENNHFEKIVDAFYRNIDKQTKNLVDEQIKINNNDKRVIIDFADIDNEYDLFERSLYVYKPFKLNDTNIKAPITRLKVTQLNKKIIIDIFINEKIYSDNVYILTQYKEKYKININNFITMYLNYSSKDEPYDEMTEDVKFILEEARGTVDSHLKNLEILLDVFEYEKMIIKKHSTKEELAKLHLRNIRYSKDDIIDDCVFFKNVKKVLEILDINQSKFLLENMSYEDYENLNLLIDIFIENEKFKIEGIKANSGIVPMEINSKKILLYQEGLGDELCLTNFFDKKNKFTYESVICSPYVFLTHNYMDSINFDEDKANIDIKKYIKTPEYVSKVILYILELIKYYDSIHNKKYLFKALDLLKWIEDKDDIYLNKINKYQIIKRLRSFNMNEVIDLVDIKNKNSEDIAIQCAVNILIEKFEDAKNNMSNMNEELLKEFKLYPIYSLMKS